MDCLLRPPLHGTRPNFIWHVKSINRRDGTRFPQAVSTTLKPRQWAQGCPLSGAWARYNGAAEWWDGAAPQACAPLSHCNVGNYPKGPDVASADNCVKWVGSFIWQIFFRKDCARMDTRARSSEGAGHRSKLSFVTKLDAIEGAQLLRACRKHLEP